VEEDPEPPTGPILVVDDGHGPILTAADVPASRGHIVIVLVVNEDRLAACEHDVRHPYDPV